jgi:hypothetical protein
MRDFAELTLPDKAADDDDLHARWQCAEMAASPMQARTRVRAFGPVG